MANGYQEIVKSVAAATEATEHADLVAAAVTRDSELDFLEDDILTAVLAQSQNDF